MNNTEFGNRLRKLRTVKGLRQDDVAKEIGLTRRSYISYEKGEAKPRKKEIYVKLADVLGCDVEYIFPVDDVVPTIGSLAEMGISALGIAMDSYITMIPVIMAFIIESSQRSKLSKRKIGNSYDADMIVKRDEKKQKLFRATALGIIVMALSKKGIKFQVAKTEDFESSIAVPEECITINEQDIDEWWFRFWARGEIEDMSGKHIKFWAQSKFSSLSAAVPNRRRKASIVVDDEELFNLFHSVRFNNSYRGNLSVILIDTENASIQKEELLSSFDINDSEDKLSIL